MFLTVKKVGYIFEGPLIFFSLPLQPSWHSKVVTALSQRRCSRCHNVAAWSKMRVVSTSVSNVVTTLLSDVVKAFPQRCYNADTTLRTGFLGHFTTNYSDFFPASKLERVTKVLSGIKHTSSLFRRTLYLQLTKYIKPSEIY